MDASHRLVLLAITITLASFATAHAQAPANVMALSVEHAREQDVHLGGPHFDAHTLRGEAGGSTTGVTLDPSCPGFFPSSPQHVIELGAVGAVSIAATADGRDLTLAVRTSDGGWHCNDDGNQPPFHVDPLVVMQSPAMGRMEVWVGTARQSVPVPYRLTLRDPNAPDRHPSRGWLELGSVVGAVSWAFMGILDVAPDLACSAVCPTDAWRNLAWIPVAGPWIASALAGTDQSNFEIAALVDATLQDIGLLAMIASVAFPVDRHHGMIALGGGRAGPLGVTITF